MNRVMLAEAAALGVIVAMSGAGTPLAAEDLARLPAVVAQPEPVPRISLEGDWLLTLPAGWQRRLSIEELGEGRYSIRGTEKLVSNGIYQLNVEDATLTLVAPDKPDTIFVWELLNINTLILTDQTHRSGGEYRGATLSRQIPLDQFVEGARVPRVGTRSHGHPGRQVDAATVRSAPDAVAARFTILGLARQDDDCGPYVENNQQSLFVDLPGWPPEALGRPLVVTGTLYTRTIRVQGQALASRRLREVEWKIMGIDTED